jgi:catalase
MATRRSASRNGSHVPGGRGAAKTLLEGGGVLATLPSGEEDPGVLIYENDEAREAIDQFVKAGAAHRHFARRFDPPVV